LVPISMDYLDAIRKAVIYLQVELGKNIVRLAFGDLHLEGVRKWREDNLLFTSTTNSTTIPLHYPIWKISYCTLLDQLEAAPVDVFISSTTIDGVHVGDRFDRKFVASLPNGVDKFGENGEFHTKVEFKKSK